MIKKNFFVITGGPASGKTTLINTLAEMGYNTVTEGAREIIRIQQETGGSALPWEDKELYSGLMLMWDIRSYLEASTMTAPVFFDRGLGDVAGYAALAGVGGEAHIAEVCSRYRYNSLVFIAPFREELYHTDSQRRQSSSEARMTEEVLRKAYTELGYELCELPPVSAAERADYVVSVIKELL